MSKKDGPPSILERVHILSHPVRHKLGELLIKTSEPLYIEEISEKTKMDRRLVSFHLLTLSEHGLVDSDFRVIKTPASKGKAGRFYRLTDSGREAMDRLEKCANE